MFDVEKAYCLNCEQQTYKKSKTHGSFIGEVLLWLLFIVISNFSSAVLLIIPLLYTLVRAFSKTKVCENCESTNLIPLNSTKAQRMLNDKK